MNIVYKPALACLEPWIILLTSKVKKKLGYVNGIPPVVSEWSEQERKPSVI